MQTAFSYIRFSNATQAFGDSLQRQIEASRTYATKHGMRLDESLQPDRGVSAFKGRNRTEGNLSAFLARIQDGTVSKGSALLVESLDRLSREEVEDALYAFLDLIRSGIEIHTLSDGQIYRKGQLKTEQLMVSLFVMSRANEESARKSERIGKVWARKRGEANGKQAMSSRVPLWLSAVKGQPITVISDRAKLVERIYRMSLAGLGQYVISGRLNAEGIPTWGKAKRWSPQSIGDLLRSRATIGEYQPHRGRAGNRQPDGEPIDYYPIILPVDVWQRVQERRVSVTKGKFALGNKGGGTNTTSNLFRGLVFDVNNDCSMVFRHSTKGKKCYDFLVSKYRGGKLQHKLSYAILERGFFSWADTFDWARLALENPTQPDQEITDQLAQIAKQVARNEKLIDRFGKIANDPDDDLFESILPKFRTAVALRKRLSERRDSLDTKLANIRSQNQYLHDSGPLLRALSRRTKQEDREILRQEIAKRIRRIEITFDAEFVVAPSVTGPLAETHGVGTLLAIHFTNGTRRYMRLIGQRLVMFH
jgi:DNA invertase Pin-like site-specific DNA recombinase